MRHVCPLILALGLSLPAEAVEPAVDQEVTAGFHRRGPEHPEDGTQAWCIGEDYLLNPLENGTELADAGAYPSTLLGEESLGAGTFTTAVYRAGPAFRVELEDTTVANLFDARGPVGMRVLSAAGGSGNLSLITRTNLRWVSTGEAAERLQGEAQITFLHPAGNAGGHIIVGLSGPTIAVEVLDNPGDPGFGNLGPIPAVAGPTYLDGQTAEVEVTIEPEFYADQLTDVVWDRITTDPAGFETANPSGEPITAESHAGDLTKATIPNVRWSGTGGPDHSCDTSIDWTIDGTFTIGGTPFTATAPGSLTATVTLGPYINGSTVPDPLIVGQSDLTFEEQADGKWKIIGAGPGTLNLTIGSLLHELAIHPNSQFFTLTIVHEDRHNQQRLDFKGPYVHVTPTNVVQTAFIAELASGRTYDTQANARATFEVVEESAFFDLITFPPGSTQRCWTERDADAHAEFITGDQWYWGVECRYPDCVGLPNCPGCGAPDGVN